MPQPVPQVKLLVFGNVVM